LKIEDANVQQSLFQTEGNLLNWDELLSLVKRTTKDSKLEKIITQKEHPILGNDRPDWLRVAMKYECAYPSFFVAGTPFFHIHPCETAKLMKEILRLKLRENHDEDEDAIYGHDFYLLTWLSIVAPIVGLSITLKQHSKLLLSD